MVLKSKLMVKLRQFIINNYLGLATNEDLKEAAKKQLIHTEWVQCSTLN